MSYYVNRYILYKIILMTQKQKVLSFLKKKEKKKEMDYKTEPQI